MAFLPEFDLPTPAVTDLASGAQCDSSIGSPLTLADVLTALPNVSSITPAQQQEMASAVRTIARLLGEDPTQIPANRRALTRRMASIAPVIHGITKPSWSNIRSRLNAALDLVLPPHLRRRRNLVLAPKWQELQERLADRWTRKTLSRFFHFCSETAISPEQVEEKTLEGFSRYLDVVRLKDNAMLLRETRRAWTKACQEVPGWPGIPFPPKSRESFYSLPWSAFPVSLQDDTRAWLERCATPSPSSWLSTLVATERPGRPRRRSRPITLKNREYQIRQFASALVLSGIDPASLKGLADLVRLETMQLGLEFYWKRHGKKVNAGLPGLIAGLQVIAREWVKAAPEDLERISDCIRDMRAALPRPGMTSKNNDRLRPFEDPENAVALLRLPGRLFDIAGETLHPHRAALLVQTSTAIEILLMAYLRISNLAALDMERHLKPVSRSRGTVHLVIPGNEVKNGQDLEYPLPMPCVMLLQRYQQDYRPILAGKNCTALFPGQFGEPKSAQTLGQQISKAVFEHTGLTMNPHLFRHTMAKLFLKLHPKDCETVRLALGHKSLATTNRYYIEYSNAAALRHFNESILNLRSETRW